MRIRTELIIFFLIIAVVPLSAVVYISYDYSKEAIRDTVMTSLLGATENSGNAIDNWMDVRKDDIRVISGSEFVIDTERKGLREYLTAYENENQGVYEEFFLLDPDGNITFSTLNRTGNASNAPYFIEASKGNLYISDVTLSENTGYPVIILANPVRKNGTISGILAARVSLENLYRILENIDIGKSGEIFIVNKDGDIIFHNNRSVILHKNINNNLAVNEVTYEKNGINEYVNYKGEKVLGSYYWLPLYRWGLVVEKKVDEAYAGVFNLERLMVTISALALITVVLVAVVISRRITGPIRSLEEGATGLLSGNFKPIPVSSRNEIGRLTKIFDDTALELLEIRKKLEVKIDIANKDLEQKNNELVAANEELKKLDELKSDIIALVSHELKTPLSSIRISAEYLESEAKNDPQAQKEMLAIILRNTERLTRLINDILDLSKIEARKMELRLEPVDISDVFNAAIENNKLLSMKKNISITVDIPEKISAVLADRERLIIVMNNLLENALKFTPDGGNVALSAKDGADSIEVRMKDTGIGIEKDKFEKIFDKFYQVDSTSRRKIGGMGLGLSIADGIIRAHGSEIHVKSEVGRGSTFSFRLKKAEK